VLAGGQFPQIKPEDLGVAAKCPAPTVSPALVGGASLWLSTATTRTAASWDYITYLTAAQQQSEWSSATGYVPVRTDR
jgi:ABC-type glycerol-3-phosphate transport system substrate-binding protein